MLTVKAPIELKCNTAIVPSHETFYHKITDSYQLIAADVTGEDLLHLVTSPPEIYLGEGSMTSIVNQTRVQNIHETNLNVINSLLNRIAFTEDVDLTYRDRVYITDVLHKLGIKNVQEFMNQVNRLRQETDMTEHLISLYWNHMDELSWIMDTYQSLRREEHVSAQAVEENVRLHLHEDIMNRLQTGAVYQILSNFYSNYAGSSRYVSRQELQISEQKRTVSQILLTQLKNTVRDRQVPLTYRHENYYENMELNELEVSDASVSTQITSAVLLNLVDSLYFSRFERHQQEYGAWFSLQNSLYQSAQNTISRLQMEAGSIRMFQNRRELTACQQNLLLAELIQAGRLLQPDLAEEEPADAGSGTEEENIRELYDFYERVERYLEAADAVVPEPRMIFERSETTYREPAERAAREELPAESEEVRSVREREDEPGEAPERILTREYANTLERMRESVRSGEEPAQPAREDMVYREGDTYTYRSEEAAAAERAPGRNAGEQAADRILSISQQNTENINISRSVSAPREEQALIHREPPREQSGQESPGASKEQKTTEEYRQEREKETQPGAERIREMIRLFPEQTRRVYERLWQYQEEPEHFRQPEEAVRESVELLMREIAETVPDDAVRQQILRELRVQDARKPAEIVIREPEAGERRGELPAGYESERVIRERDVSRQEVTNRLLTREYESPLERITEQYPAEAEPEQTQPREAEMVYQEGSGHTYLTEEQPAADTAPEETERELILQLLQQISQQNTENYNRYRQLLAERTGQQRRRREKPAERTRRESLIALENPQQMMEEYRQDQAAREEKGAERMREIISLLPEQTRRVYERLERYREDPERFRQTGEISRDNLGMLMRDIEEIERENVIRRQETEESRERERIREVSETVLERWQEQPQAAVRERRQEETSRTDVALIHKTAENMLDEEFLQELLAQNRQTRETTQVTEHVQTERQTVSRTVHEVNRQTQVKEEQQNINELIRRGIQSQIRPLSEQVYSRLERRLQNEKKRRGY